MAATLVTDKPVDISRIPGTEELVHVRFDPHGELVEILYDDGSYDVISVNLISQGYMPLMGHAFIKNYSENSGIVEKLEAAGIVEPVKRIHLPPFGAECVEVIFTSLSRG